MPWAPVTPRTPGGQTILGEGNGHLQGSSRGMPFAIHRGHVGKQASWGALLAGGDVSSQVPHLHPVFSTGSAHPSGIGCTRESAHCSQLQIWRPWLGCTCSPFLGSYFRQLCTKHQESGLPGERNGAAGCQAVPSEHTRQVAAAAGARLSLCRVPELWHCSGVCFTEES